MTDEADTTPEGGTAPTDYEGKSASEIAGIRDTLEGGDAAAAAENAEGKDGTQQTGKADGQDDAEKVATSDFSFLADEIQQTLKENPDMPFREALALHEKELRDSTKRLDAYSRDKNKLREEHQLTDEQRQYAERYQALMQDREAAEALQSLDERRRKGRGDIEIPEDADEWTAREAIEFVLKQLPKRDERVKELAKEELKQELRAPMARLEHLDELAGRYMGDNEISKEDMEAAAVAIQGKPRLMASITDENYADVFEFVLGNIQKTTKLNVFQESEKDRLEKLEKARSASPRGQRGASAPVAPASSNGKDDKPWTAADQHALMLKALGTTEAELDREIGQRTR